jgi:hypothetical protein
MGFNCKIVNFILPFSCKIVKFGHKKSPYVNTDRKTVVIKF